MLKLALSIDRIQTPPGLPVVRTGIGLAACNVSEMEYAKNEARSKCI